MRNRVSRAFTLVEILIVVVILGILAAIVIPQFTSASEEAQVGNVQTQLQTIRSQIELFRVRNNGNPPAIVGAQDASFSDLKIDTLQDGINNSFGNAQARYVRTPPNNPRNNRNEVVEDATPIVSAQGAAADPAGAGWLYNSGTGEFSAAGFDETLQAWVP